MGISNQLKALATILNLEDKEVRTFLEQDPDTAAKTLISNINASLLSCKKESSTYSADVHDWEVARAAARVFAKRSYSVKELTSDPSRAVEMLNSINGLNEGFCQQRIAELLAKSADNGLSKLGNAPSQEVLDKLTAAIPDYAWEIIRQAARVFADDGLEEEEFLKDVDHQLNGYALLAVDGEPESVTIRINGKPRRLGNERATPSFGHLHYELGGKSLDDCRSTIRELAWDRYQELVVKPGALSVPEKRDLYARLVRLQGIRYADVGSFINVSEHTAKKWAVDSEQIVGTKAYPSQPPVDVLEVLAISGLQWASNVVSNAFGDSRKKKPVEFQPLVPAEYWVAIARLKPANAVEIDRGDQPKRRRGRPKKVMV
ncbi:hypothetical protein LH464_23420 [Neorhizobium sp. T786]|uniref:hypothetical protein n=1 Tax=Pseudorhizobium xiangyangii TaxID=2883104 RepID=UPI001CFF8227|nr:hypothetical protein [Neorhizobium xiangyangii]MCB5205414.1 hypothetical protein [Neorhizobium xiangyangii]